MKTYIGGKKINQNKPKFVCSRKERGFTNACTHCCLTCEFGEYCAKQGEYFECKKNTLEVFCNRLHDYYLKYGFLP